MEPWSSLPHSQEPANHPYPEPHKPSPCSHSIYLRPILILSSHLRLGIPGELFPFPPPPCVLYAPHISFFFTWSPEFGQGYRS